jgi:hypothetical protein
MKVYVLIELGWEDEDATIEGIFTTRAAAQAIIDADIEAAREYVARADAYRKAQAARWINAGGGLSEPVAPTAIRTRRLLIEEHDLRE